MDCVVDENVKTYVEYQPADVVLSVVRQHNRFGMCKYIFVRKYIQGT